MPDPCPCRLMSPLSIICNSNLCCLIVHPCPPCAVRLRSPASDRVGRTSATMFLFRRRLLRVAMLVASEGNRISFARARCRYTHTCLKLFASSRRHDSALGSMVSDLEPEMRHTLHEKWKRQQVTRSSSTQENLSTIGFVSPLLIAGAALRLCRQPASLVAPHRQSMRTASTGGSCGGQKPREFRFACPRTNSSGKDWDGMGF